MAQEQTDVESVKYMDLVEFMRLGFLQEANRRFFHPLGLALEMEVADDGAVRLSGIWDYRDDPEGIVFGSGAIDAIKIASVAVEGSRHLAVRELMFGRPGSGGIQPVGWVPSDDFDG